MRNPILIVAPAFALAVALAVTAGGCGSAAAGDNGNGDARLGELTLPCDTVYLPTGIPTADFYAVATPEQLPGAFTAFYCDYIDPADQPVPLRTLCELRPEDCPTTSNVLCDAAPADTITLLEDGTYWFFCGSVSRDQRATMVRILR